MSDYEQFTHENVLFQKLMQGNDMLTPEEFRSVEIAFKDRYPEKDFNTFLFENNLFPEDICTNAPIFDTKLKKTYNANILNPIRRTKIDTFNIYEFLNESIQNNQLCYLNFDPTPDVDFDDERENSQIMVARESLKDIAKIILFLNQQKKDIPYTILEVIQQRYIN